MKKIIATVLAMVMALALCTTAFAAGEVKGFVKATTKDAVISNAEVTLDFTAARTPKPLMARPLPLATLLTTPLLRPPMRVTMLLSIPWAEADLVVYSDKDGKNVMMYLDKIIPHLYRWYRHHFR